MKKLALLIAAIIGFTQFSHSQSLEWAKMLGPDLTGLGACVGFSITTDSNGNVFTTGNFNGVIDFDPGENVFTLNAPTSLDIYVSKLNPSGNFVWAKQMGGPGTDRGLSISTDLEGNVYTAGVFTFTADFDPGPGNFNLTTQSQDIFISKLDSMGNFIWAKQFSGTSSKNISTITTDHFGNIYTTGGFMGTVDFDPGPSVFNLTSNVSNQNDIFICKLDKDGNFIWARQMGGTNADYGYSLSIDAFGNVYTTGNFRGTSDFDPGSGVFNLVSSGNSDIFISKLDSSGNFVWAKRMGGAENDGGRGITTDLNGSVYVIGDYRDTVDFNPGSAVFNMVSAGGTDVFVCKLDSNGNFVWAWRTGGTQSDFGKSIKVNTAGEVLIAGNFSGTVFFDLGPANISLTSVGSSDMFIAKLNPQGNFASANQLGGPKTKTMFEIALYGNDKLYATGSFSGVVDFDPSTTTFNLATDSMLAAFIYKQNDFPLSVINYSNTNLISLYPNPTSGNLNILFDRKQDQIAITIRNILGQIIHRSNYTLTKEIILEIDGAAGLYLVELHNGRNKTIYKVIKQ